MDTPIIVAIIAAIATIMAAVIGLIGIIISNRNKQNKIEPIDDKANRYLHEPTLITASRKNRQKIESTFLGWSQCTIMLWVLVPPKGEGLRDSPSNKYLLAHHTGEANKENWTYYNQLALRHSSKRNKWEVLFSNGKKPPEYPKSPLIISDGLEPGWHQFIIAWDRNKPKITFMIDGSKGGNDLLVSFSPYWPEKLAENVIVGTFVNEWSGHYCDTSLYQLWIVDNYLESSDSVIKEHFNLKPGI